MNLVKTQVLTKVMPRASLGLMLGPDNGGNVYKIQVFPTELIYILLGSKAFGRWFEGAIEENIVPRGGHYTEEVMPIAKEKQNTCIVIIRKTINKRRGK